MSRRTSQHGETVEVGGIPAVVVKRQSLSVLVPLIFNGTLHALVIIKMKLRIVHHFP